MKISGLFLKRYTDENILNKKLITSLYINFEFLLKYSLKENKIISLWIFYNLLKIKSRGNNI